MGTNTETSPKGPLAKAMLLGVLLAFAINFIIPFVIAIVSGVYSGSHISPLTEFSLGYPINHFPHLWPPVFENMEVLDLMFWSCIPLGILLGSLRAKRLGRRSPIPTALLFSFVYMLVASLSLAFASLGLSMPLDVIKMNAELNIDNTLLFFGVMVVYFYGVVFVISLIGCWLGSLFNKKALKKPLA